VAGANSCWQNVLFRVSTSKAAAVVKGTRFLELRRCGDRSKWPPLRYRGADELVFLDITASHEDRNIILTSWPHGEQVFMR